MISSWSNIPAFSELSLVAKSHSVSTRPVALNPDRGFPTTDFFQQECSNNLETLIRDITYPGYDLSHISSAHSRKQSFEAMDALFVLASLNELTLIWVPGHRGILGNE